MLSNFVDNIGVVAPLAQLKYVEIFSVVDEIDCEVKTILQLTG